MRRALALLALLALAAGAAAADPKTESGLFVGALGGKPVAAQLETQAGKILGGRYFYRQFGRDIQLIRDKQGRLLECPSQDFYNDEGCEKPSGLWQAAVAAAGIEGRWTSLDGAKALPLALAAGPAVRDAEAEFARLRREGGKQNLSPVRRSNGIAWQVRKDVRSGMSMPFLVEGVGDAVMARVNALLQKQFERDIEEALTAADYSSANELLFANPRYLAVGGGSGAYYMGAAHPLYGFGVTVFELATGAPVDMKGLFRFSEPKAEAIDLRRSDLLDALALRAYQREAKKESGDEGCLTAVVDRYGCEGNRCGNNERFEYALLYPTEKGLAVTIDIYSEAERGCRGEGVVLPWSAVRKTLLQPVPMP